MSYQPGQSPDSPYGGYGTPNDFAPTGPSRAPAIAVLLELGGGIFQTFGIGHIYAGNLGLGLGIMFGYWFILFCNLRLCLVIIGFITGPICWFLAMIMSPVVAAKLAGRSTY